MNIHIVIAAIVIIDIIAQLTQPCIVVDKFQIPVAFVSLLTKSHISDFLFEFSHGSLYFFLIQYSGCSSRIMKDSNGERIFNFVRYFRSLFNKNKLIFRPYYITTDNENKNWIPCTFRSRKYTDLWRVAKCRGRWLPGDGFIRRDKGNWDLGRIVIIK